jgi:hypothetical protein
MDFVELLGGAFHQEVGEPGSSPGVDERGAILFSEVFVIAQLLSLEWIASQMRAEVDIMSTKSKGGAENAFIENRRGGVDDDVAALGGTHNAAQVTRVDRSDGDGGFHAEKTAGAGRIAVATPNIVALPL